MKYCVLLITCFAVLGLAGCFAEPEERYDISYDDGYTVGYNTTCKIKVTLIEGDWENKDYSRGYNNGYADGEVECKGQM